MSDKNKTPMQIDEEFFEEGDFGGEENISENGDSGESVTMPKNKLVILKKLLSNISENTEKLNELLSAFISPEDESRISLGQMADEGFKGDEDGAGEGRIIEGVFDGENMIGPDGKIYSVPANYASKSKLVEGDIMKLTITANGTFIYKQIGPIERGRVVGNLEKAPDGSFSVVGENKRWRVLTASVTYYKGQDGDEAIILVPKSGESKWAAVENVIRKVF